MKRTIKLGTIFLVFYISTFFAFSKPVMADDTATCQKIYEISKNVYSSDPILEDYMKNYMLSVTGTEYPVIQTTMGPFLKVFAWDGSGYEKMTKYTWVLANKSYYVNRNIVCLPEATQEEVNLNVAAIDRLYDLMKQCKAETENMNDRDKVVYCWNLTNALIGNSAPDQNWKYYMGPSLMNGSGCCSAKRTMFDFLAKACGLNCEIVSGTDLTYQQAHGWNRVYIDGVTYVTDTTKSEAFLLMPEAESLIYYRPE